MAFLIIAPSTNARGDRVFSLAARWAHPYQGCLSNQPWGNGLSHINPMATSSQVSPGEVMLGHIPSIVQFSHSPSPSTMLKTPNVASISPSPQSWVTQGQSSQPTWWGALIARGHECGPGVAAHDQGHPELLLKRAGAEHQHCQLPKWDPGYWGHQRGRSPLCSCH